jgi:L-iditol 2-dehydrogenase
LVEPVSIAVHGVERGNVALGDTAVVVGTGMVGLLVVQALRAAGCGKIIAVDLQQAKLDLALTLGANVALKADECNVAEEVQKQTDGRGADVALEVVGLSATVNTAIACLRKGGTLTLVGNLSPKIDMPLQAIVTRELTLAGTCGSRNEYPACLDLLSRGVIKTDPLISATAPLAEGAAWFKRLHQSEPGLLKVILHC